MKEFLDALAKGLAEPVELHCLGGFVISMLYGVYLQQVGVATVPEDYLTRMIPMFPNRSRKVRLMGLEAHDLALSKLERNDRRDREDVRFLGRAGHISVTELERR